MIIARSPLRISLGGGGTDLPSYYRDHGGFLIAGTIDKNVYVTVHRAFNEGLLLRYSNIEKVSDLDDIKHPIFREALRMLHIDIDHLEISTFADLHAGSGLGSSGSFGTALLKALHRLERRSVSQADLAEEACRIEIDILHEPVGKQDQYAAAFGGINCYTFAKDGSVTVEPLTIDESTLLVMKTNLLLFSTGISRSASKILKTQDDQTQSGDNAMIENLHFVKEIGLKSRQHLEEGDIAGFGKLLDEHWQHKKRRSKLMTNADIDHWYDVAQNAGALGGKLIGAGGGGFLMFYAEDPQRLRCALREEGLVEMPFSFAFEGTKLLDGGVL